MKWQFFFSLAEELRDNTMVVAMHHSMDNQHDNWPNVMPPGSPLSMLPLTHIFYSGDFPTLCKQNETAKHRILSFLSANETAKDCIFSCLS